MKNKVDTGNTYNGIKAVGRYPDEHWLKKIHNMINPAAFQESVNKDKDAKRVINNEQ